MIGRTWAFEHIGIKVIVYTSEVITRVDAPGGGD